MDFVAAGRAFLLSEYQHQKLHLCFILTDPDCNPAKVVGVMVRTRKRFTDDTVILCPGDHPFIKHESAVHYSTADFFTVAKIVKCADQGHCHIQPDMTPELLRRVRQGLLDSPYTVRGVKDYCCSRF